MTILFTSGLILLLLGLDLLDPSLAAAWGPGVHTVTLLHALGRSSTLLPDVASVLTAFPREYLYGGLAADFFIGKTQRRGLKHPHNWPGGLMLLEAARSRAEKAFAFGFLSHLAADVIAHNCFVPTLIACAPAPNRKLSHLMAELKADYVAGPYYTKIARGVLRMNANCGDSLMEIVSAPAPRTVKAKKRLYTQTVGLFDWAHTTRDIFDSVPGPKRLPFDGYLGLMVDLSCRAVVDILSRADKAACLAFDPLGPQPVRANTRRVRRWSPPDRKRAQHSARTPARRF